jgi:hypothetical protein
MVDVLQRLVVEKATPRPAGPIGGSLRSLVLGQLYEALAQLNHPSGGLCKHDWARRDVQQALGLAAQIGGACWSREQRTAIERWGSTLRARGV